MTKKILKNVLLVAATLTLFSFGFAIPEGWFPAGSLPASYDMGVEKASGQDGKNAATIKSTKKKIEGFGTLMQNCLPDKFIGKRVRLSGYMKSKDVESWAGFWMRVDQEGTQHSLSFDNMHDRAIKGTTEWKKYEIVLDVPAKASNIAYGALLNGTGQIWFDKLNFEVVDSYLPTTGKGLSNAVINKEPVNLDFEEGK
ncbi:MAG: hypothetical protein IAF38_13010 [Bacteroidia bacterium]|nr:hypothetical protein [Bacteroidia bacterium]